MANKSSNYSNFAKDLEKALIEEAIETKTLVFFDLETTGLYHTNPDILQISAVRLDCCDSFDKYLLPMRKKQIDSDVEKLINIKYDSKDSKLYKIGDGKRSKLLPAMNPKQGLSQFISWLQSIYQQTDSKVVLIAYNAFGFDALVLMNRLKEHNLLRNFKSFCAGFCDPLILAKERFSMLRNRKLENMLKYFQLIQEDEEQTHNAISDAYHLLRLTKRFNAGEDGQSSGPMWSMLQNYFKSTEEIEILL